MEYWGGAWGDGVSVVVAEQGCGHGRVFTVDGVTYYA